ncbi:hypothetical protein [Gloeocapsopsis dulcis]|uniref:Uncharacterized protein n=2 Tax=Gloeocapsopsis TaxID=693222 RepID=A0A6N8FR91_9CHRO|nr:hypothetical protein [Gloeocapsopsis dulcis]MUL35409.1 hypothetical protein [Gloeocapsopsis dulcis AAB1 = 1H9]
MVSSETQKRAISLGKALVQELGLETGVDTLSRWMAHYVAEQIALAENAISDEKSEAEQRCFETVLKLWERRSSLPNDRYPFKSFEPIFKALNRIDPDNSQSYYFDDSRFQATANNNDTSKSQTNEVQSWINIALGIDRAARVLIDFALKQAACNAADEKTIAWIENATGISVDDENDISVIIRLVGETREDDHDEETLEKMRQGFRSRIEKLDAFIEFSSLLRTELVKELEN